METTNIETMVITSAVFAAVIVAYVLLTGYWTISPLEYFIIPQDALKIEVMHLVIKEVKSEIKDLSKKKNLNSIGSNLVTILVGYLSLMLPYDR